MADTHDDEDNPGGIARRTAIIGRLYRVLEAKLAEIEQRAARASNSPGQIGSPAEGERDARSLNSLARLLEKLAELDDAARTTREGTDNSELIQADIDAERYRRDIAERLGRMLKGEQD